MYLKITGVLVSCALSLLFILYCSDAFAGQLIRYLGYHVLLSICVVFGYYCSRLLRGADWWSRARCRVEALSFVLAVFVGVLCVLNHAKFDYKIVADEYLLASTAKQLHEARELSYGSVGVDVGGDFELFNTRVDKRPWLYPFVVACAHDILGFNYFNPFLVNVLAGIFLLGLAYIFGFQCYSRAGGWLAVLLWASLPLLAQNASGAGMELVNLSLLQMVLCISVVYLKSPNVQKAGCLLLLGVLLSYARYESILFLFPIVAVIMIGWVQVRAVKLPWVTVMVLPMLLFVLLQNKIYTNTESSWEIARKGVQPFSIENIAVNFPHAIYYFFGIDPALSNSIFLSIAGLIALIGFFVCSHNKQLRTYWRHDPAWITVLIFGVSLSFHLLVLLSFHASRLDSPFVSRYALPFHLLLVCLTVLAVGVFASKWKSLWRTVFILLTCFIVTVSFPSNAKAVFSERNYMVREKRWLFRAQAELFSGKCLMIDEFNLKWLLYDQSSIAPAQALEVLPMDGGVFKFDNFDSVYLVARYDYRSNEFRYKSPAEEELLSLVSFELVEEMSFRPFELTRLYRLKGAHRSE
ncbi:glycosyltransferase family 39 protein [Lentimonas sp. CC21]|uniref:glycosyltransferase family 39 protein n=1 Tax=Lentimonas sp. CC21 TaxID=2676098 RepID=UPI001A7E2921|nr:glycosyltransferase family 39 protein [Lentimonas sp. CC21]